MKTLVHDIARLSGFSLLIALALTVLVIATSHAGTSPVAAAHAAPAGATDTLGACPAWPAVALVIVKPALRAVRIGIVETIRVADLIVFRSYGVRRLAHFTGVRDFDRFPWAAAVARATCAPAARVGGASATRA
jgi:hypothetical protein